MTDILTREEERDLVMKAKTGDVSARNKVVMGFARLVRNVASKMSSRCKIDSDDLYQVGILKILEKFDKFDPNRQVLNKTTKIWTYPRPCTYLLFAAKRAMERYIKQDGIIKKTVDGAMGTIEKVVSIEEYQENKTNQKKLNSQVPIKETLVFKDGDDFTDTSDLVKCINKLPDSYQSLLYHRMSGCTLQAYADSVKLSKNAIHLREKRALQKMKEIIENSPNLSFA